MLAHLSSHSTLIWTLWRHRHFKKSINLSNEQIHATRRFKSNKINWWTRRQSFSSTALELLCWFRTDGCDWVDQCPAFSPLIQPDNVSNGALTAKYEKLANWMQNYFTVWFSPEQHSHRECIHQVVLVYAGMVLDMMQWKNKLLEMKMSPFCVTTLGQDNKSVWIDFHFIHGPQRTNQDDLSW